MPEKRIGVAVKRSSCFRLFPDSFSTVGHCFSVGHIAWLIGFCPSYEPIGAITHEDL